MIFQNSKIHQNSLREFSIILDLLAMAMEAGHDFQIALDHTIQYGPEASILPALKKVRSRLSMGTSRIQSLREFQMETHLTEISGLIQSIHLSENLGGNLGKVLKIHAQALRNKRLLAAEKIIHKIPVYILFPLILFIFPCVFLILLTPIIYQIYLIM